MSDKESIEEILLTVDKKTGNIRVEASVAMNAHRLIGILEAAKVAVIKSATIHSPQSVVDSLMHDLGIKEKGGESNDGK